MANIHFAEDNLPQHENNMNWSAILRFSQFGTIVYIVDWIEV